MIAAVKVPRGATVFAVATDAGFALLMRRLLAEDFGRGPLQVDVFPDPPWGVPPRPRLIRPPSR